MREDDTRFQIDLLTSTVSRKMSGVILAPVEMLPLRTPVYRLTQRGIPVVIVGTDLGLPSGDYLSYVLNDEKLGGELAAQEVGTLLHGHGDIALLGIRYQLSSTNDRTNSIESTLHRNLPSIHVAYRSLAFSSVALEQQAVEKLLSANPSIKAIVALSESSTRGAFYALQDLNKVGRIHIVGFDQNLLVPLRTGGIDAVIMQDTHGMGKEAVKLLAQEMRKESHPGMVVLPPVLVTHRNIDSQRVKDVLDLEWYRP